MSVHCPEDYRPARRDCFDIIKRSHLKNLNGNDHQPVLTEASFLERERETTAAVSYPKAEEDFIGGMNP